MNKFLLMIGWLAVSLGVQAQVDDRAMLGTFAIDCANPAKGEIIVSMSSVQLVTGEKVTAVNKLADVTSDYFGNRPAPASFVGAINLSFSDKADGTIEVSRDKRGVVARTAGNNEALLAAGPVFNRQQHAFRKCPAPR